VAWGIVRAVTIRLSIGLCAVLAGLAGCAPAPTPGEASSPEPSPSASPSPPVSASATPSVALEPSSAPAGWHRLRVADGPSPREDFTWTLTPNGSVGYLFGGRSADGSALGDLWTYDLETDRWREVNARGPAPRFGHNAAWVRGRGLVVFAGQAGAAFFNDLWAFDPAVERWRKLPGGGAVPVPRYGSCASVGPDGRLWISHGFTSEGSRFSDTRAYDFSVGAWTDETPAAEVPVERCLHACWWTDDGAFALYAGQTTGILALGDLWHLTPGRRPGTNAWSRVRFDREGMPPARQLYASTRWKSSTLVFGGLGVNGEYLDDLWVIEDDGVTERYGPTVPPPARSGAELLPDRARNRVLLFGGKDASGVRGDLWELRLPE
jgi:Galactose oxidase, central domain